MSAATSKKCSKATSNPSSTRKKVWIVPEKRYNDPRYELYVCLSSFPICLFFMIYYDKVTKIYNGGLPAVQDVTLSIDPGEFVSIVGHSGAGKTTLLKMLFAEVQP